MSNQSGKDILNEAKNKVKKQKDNNTMKTNKFKTPLTILATLLTVAAFAFTFYQGALYGASNERAKNAEVHSQVKSLTTVVKK